MPWDSLCTCPSRPSCGCAQWVPGIVVQMDQSNPTGIKFARSHAARFCPRFSGDATWAGTCRLRCHLRHRGCGSSHSLRALSVGRIDILAALHRHGRHTMTEKHLRPAGAIRGPSSIGSMPANASDAAIAVFVGIDHGTLEALCPALVELAIFHATTLSNQRLIDSLFCTSRVRMRSSPASSCHRAELSDVR